MLFNYFNSTNALSLGLTVTRKVCIKLRLSTTDRVKVGKFLPFSIPLAIENCSKRFKYSMQHDIGIIKST